MASRKSKVSQIQKDANKLLADTEKSIQRQARDALKGIRKMILELAKQTEQLEKKLEGNKKKAAPKKKPAAKKKAVTKKKAVAKKKAAPKKKAAAKRKTAAKKPSTKK
ncbi:histone [Seongchinamella unica]|uniref:histone n=1 Tax=Seongchinamella unica TaxID=2547392 RepID=UPI0014042B2C|nr:histone [Seongchinamella unica]